MPGSISAKPYQQDKTQSKGSNPHRHPQNAELWEQEQDLKGKLQQDEGMNPPPVGLFGAKR